MIRRPAAFSMLAFLGLTGLLGYLGWDWYAEQLWVYGNDERERIAITTQPAFSPICKLIVYENGKELKRVSGTGFLWTPTVVVTAAHCLRPRGRSEYYEEIVVVPAMNEWSVRPYGEQRTAKANFHTTKGWNDKGLDCEDYGVIILDQPFENAGKTPGQLSLVIQPEYEIDFKLASITGYPVPVDSIYDVYPEYTMWSATDQIDYHDACTLHYFVDTMPGQSGSPIVMSNNVVGIHTSNHRDNSGVRITADVMKQLKTWRDRH